MKATALPVVLVACAVFLPAAAGASTCDDPFGCTTTTPAHATKPGSVKRLTYRNAKRVALRRARKVAHHHGGKVTTLLNVTVTRPRWYAQVTFSDACWIGLYVALKHGHVRTRVSDYMCEDAPSSPTGGSGCPECFQKPTDIAVGSRLTGGR